MGDQNDLSNSSMAAAGALLMLLAVRAAGLEPLALEDCRITAGPAYPSIRARCGRLVRPLDPAAPSGESIELRFAVVPALSLEPARDPFVPIAGGPGAGSVEFYAANASAFEQVRRERDVLLLDQRGTGESAPLDCDTDDDLVGGELSPEVVRAETEACLSALPYDPRYFTTSVAVADLEALRRALDYGPLNLYGSSYGTRVAQHFARRYPGSTRTLVLDGVVPPQLALGPAIATEAQQALDRIFARCTDSAPCRNRFPDIAAEFDGLKRVLAAGPQPVSVAHPVSGAETELAFGASELAASVRMLSYHPSTTALIPFLVHEAAAGNLEPLAAQFLMIADSLSDALSLGMHNAVMCTEDAPYFDGEAVTDEELGATYMGPLMLRSLRAICEVWPPGVIDDDFKTPLGTDLPVLLLSGDADPITPPSYAEMAAVDFDNAALLIGRRQGHGQAMRGCMPEIIGEFVQSAAPAELDTDCLSRQFAMPFFLDRSGPVP